MAIRKSKEQPSGHSAEYHVVENFALINGGASKQNSVVVSVASYKDEAARAASKEPQRSSFRVNDAADEMSLAAAYEALKAQPGYEDAEDC